MARVLCMQATETIDNLYFQCPYSAYLWELSRLKLGLTTATGSLIEEATLISNKFKQKCNTTTLAKVVFSAVIWHIWREKNARIFQHENEHKILVFKEIYPSSDATLCMKGKKRIGT